jgi:hypothetical protein
MQIGWGREADPLGKNNSYGINFVTAAIALFPNPIPLHVSLNKL